MEALNKQNQRQRLEAMELVLAIWQHNEKIGSFLGRCDDGYLFLFDGKTKRIIPLQPGLPLDTYLQRELKLLSRSTAQERDAVNILQTMASNEPACKVHRFSFWDVNTRTLYLSCYNGQVLKLTGSAINTIDNGTEVFFMDDDQGAPIDPKKLDVQQHGMLFSKLVKDIQYAPLDELTPELQAICLQTWILALPFAEAMPGFPILLLEGEKGSGKTTAIKRVQRLVLGRTVNRILNKKSADDFPVMLLRSPICLLDNVDSYVGWLPDQIAAFVTGGGWTKRKLYSDNEEVTVVPVSRIVVTTRSPSSFKRDDVRDRLIILRLERRENRGGYLTESELLGYIDSNRHQLYGEWLWYLNRIVKRIRVEGMPTVTDIRLSDYASLICCIGETMGINTERIKTAFRAQASERTSLATEDNFFLELMDEWIEKNLGKTFKIGQIYAQLDTLAYGYGVKISDFMRSPQSLGQYLRWNQGAILGDKYNLTKEKNARFLSYTFTRKEDAAILKM